MSFASYPIQWILVLGILLAISAVVAACMVRGGVKRALLVTVATLCLLLPSYLMAAAFYLDIEIGMNRDQVLAAMEKRYPADGPRQRPTIMEDTDAELGFFMNPEHSYEPNCEGIFLDFANGQVVRKHYSRD